MKFSNINSRIKLSEKENNSELIDNVYKLVECFVHSDGYLQAQTDTLDTTIAGNALVAATLAERQITELSSRIHELEKLAMTDELTGLMNRRGFEIELCRALSSANRNDEHGVLIYIDLDGFKPVNDHLGHAAGDEVLRHVGRLLKGDVRDTDYICRLGGDEFAVLMPRTIWKNGLLRAGVIEKNLNSAIANWQSHKISIQASLGLQGYSAGDDPSELLKGADEDMYKTKRIRSELIRKEINPTKVKDKSIEPLPIQLQYAAS